MGTGKLLGKPDKLREVTCNGLASRPGEVKILLAASCYRNRDKLRQLLASLGSKASHFTSFPRVFHSTHIVNTAPQNLPLFLDFF